LEKDQISKESILNRIKYIDAAIKDINEVLSKLNSITNPKLSDYAKDVKMVKVEGEEEN